MQAGGAEEELASAARCCYRECLGGRPSPIDGRSAVERESRANLLGLADASLIVGLLELGCAVGWVPGMASWVWLPPPQR